MADANSFRLYGESLWISPYVFSSFVALREKGAAFEVVELDFSAGAHLEPGYRDASLTARVPSLEHQGFRLSESSAIAEYLEEVLPPPGHPRLLPAAPRDRARARQLMAWLRSDLGALREERSTVTMLYRFKLAPLSKSAARDAEKLQRVADQVLPAGASQLFGAWSLVDSELAFMLHRLILNGDSVAPRLLEYARAQWQRPSVRAFIEHARPAAVPEGYWAVSGTPRPASLPTR